MRDSIEIRAARPDDAEIAAVLLYSAYTHTLVTYPLHDENADGFVQRLQNSFRRDDNRFSYQNVQVADQNSAVLGLVLSFGGRDEPRLNAAIGPWLNREAQDDEWYVDALAVLKPWVKHGIGTSLLQTAERQARRHHYTKIVLNVAQDNKRAIDLYTHLDFQATKETILYQSPHIRMEKSVEDGEGDNNREP